MSQKKFNSSNYETRMSQIQRDAASIVDWNVLIGLNASSSWFEVVVMQSQLP